jgi:hypothetical protein
MSGGGGATTSTTNTSNIPDWLKPQVQSLLGGATQQIFNTKPSVGTTNPDGTTTEGGYFDITGVNPFVPYSANPSDYVAGFSPLQTQAQVNTANLQMPGQYGQASQLAGAAGVGGMQSADQAYGFGTAGYNAGMQGLSQGQYAAQQSAQDAAALQNAAFNYGGMGAGFGQQAANAGANYANQATNPYAVNAYMNPYIENVIQNQNLAAQRQADIASTQRGANAAKAGAFGGSRQAIENAEAQRSLESLMNTNRATGLNTAYNNAIQNMQYGAGLNLQGLQGAQQGLGTALQGIGQATNAGQYALQGAGLGLQGTAQGIQGAGLGLQGVGAAQSGYGLGNTAASNLGNLGNQQLAAQTGIIGLQNQVGAQQQQNMQDIINNAINNYSQAQQYPMQQLNNYNALLRGYAMPGQTTTSYQAQPTLVNQLAGLGTAGIGGLSLYNAMNPTK